MGQVTILDERQKQLLAQVGKDERFTSQFYFTGGTALSELYLKHRESEDLDLFSPKKFDSEFIGRAFDEWAKDLKFTVTSRFVDPTLIFELDFGGGQLLKVDFAHYPYPQLDKSGQEFLGIPVDSLLDIGVNKLLAITQRAEVKDFVDLRFILDKFTFWDLREGVRKKFNRDIEPYVMAADMLVVEAFTYLPKMIKPLTLSELKSFFRHEAKKLGKTAVQT